MAFYKREGETLSQAPTFVYNSEYHLTIENHTDHQYPVDGWYWFETLDEAMSSLVSPPDVPTVTALQGMLAISRSGLVPAFMAWKASLDPVIDFEIIAFLDKAETWEYDNPIIDDALTDLGVAEQKPALFTLAATL